MCNPGNHEVEGFDGHVKNASRGFSSRDEGVKNICFGDLAHLVLIRTVEFAERDSSSQPSQV